MVLSVLCLVFMSLLSGASCSVSPEEHVLYARLCAILVFLIIKHARMLRLGAQNSSPGAAVGGLACQATSCAAPQD